MIKKKVCMLGSFAVGKTSLVQQYVKSIFSEKYHTSIGVKIDQKRLEVDEQEVNLLLWDIHGEDEFQKIPASYLKGTSGYFLVMDGTRKSTFEVIKKLKIMADSVIGKDVPFILLTNKADLSDKWEIDETILAEISANGWYQIDTSAKTGLGVEEAFFQLAKNMLS